MLIGFLLAELVCGTGSGVWGEWGGEGWSGRSHENAVVNQAAAFQRRCNDKVGQNNGGFAGNQNT